MATSCTVFLLLRFETLEPEMNALAARITAVNDIAEQLLKAKPPGKDSIVTTQKQLNHRWAWRGEPRKGTADGDGSRRGVLEGMVRRLKTRQEGPLVYIAGQRWEMREGVEGGEGSPNGLVAGQGAIRGSGEEEPGAASLTQQSRWCLPLRQGRSFQIDPDSAGQLSDSSH